MSASSSDLITDTRNAARPVATTVASPRNSGATSLACNALTGWPTASKVHFVTYQIDANSNPIAGTQLDCYGIVSGNTIGSLVVVDGTDNGNSIGDTVEMLPTAQWGQDLATALTSTHNRSGGLKTGITLTQPTIADFTSATHAHANAAGGGQLTASAFANNAITGPLLATNAIQLGTAAITSGVTISTSASDQDISGLSVTVTVPAGGRNLLILAQGSDYEQSGGIGTVYGVIRVKEGSTVLKNYGVVPSVANFPNGWSLIVPVAAPTAGSHTYKIAVGNNSTGPTFTIGASATDPASITILLV